MEKITLWMEKYVVPVASKVGNQRHLLAIRDGFLAMIGLTMVSSLATFVLAFPNKAYKAWLKSSEVGQALTSIANDINWGAFTFMALIIAFAVGNSLWKSYEKEGFEGGLVAVAAFLIVSPKTISMVSEAGEVLVSDGLNPSYFGATSLFTSLIVSMIAVECLRVLASCKKLEIKLPEMVPPAVSKSFATMFPAMITLAIVSIVNHFILRFSGNMCLTDIITKVLQVPLTGVTDTLGAAIMYPLFIGVFWALGIHGSSIVNSVASPLLVSLATENMNYAQLIGTAQEVPLSQFNTITTPFFSSFVWIGGAGATLALLISARLAGKRVKERYNAISSIGMAPGIFNINEPVIFGLPIVLNPILMLPFIVIPVVLSVFSFFMIKSGLVHPTILASIPWTTPVGISGFMSTGHWTGAALSIFNLILSVILYIPFVKISVIVEEKQLQKEREISND